MLSNNRTAGIVAACIASLALCGHARAEFFDFAPGMGNPLNPNLAGPGSHPYDWYYQHIALEYGGGWTDGSMLPGNQGFKDGGNNPYFNFDGTDKSTAGHCLQVAVTPATGDELFPTNIQNLHISYVDTFGNDQAIIGQTNLNFSDAYSTFRLWVKNDGSGLNWRIKIADMDGDSGSWHQAANLNIWRVDLNQADCTTNAKATYPSLFWVTFIGHTGSYTACTDTGGCHGGG
jgi:hypothetical protein